GMPHVRWLPNERGEALLLWAQITSSRGFYGTISDATCCSTSTGSKGNRITFTFRATPNGRRLSIAVPIVLEPTGSMRLPLLLLARFSPIAAVSAPRFARTAYSAPSSIGWLSMAG
ncbi:MAG: hypothetical protein B7X78_11420, partial [Sphingomonadales bacterium 39-62-4]